MVPADVARLLTAVPAADVVAVNLLLEFGDLSAIDAEMIIKRQEEIQAAITDLRLQMSLADKVATRLQMLPAAPTADPFFEVSA